MLIFQVLYETHSAAQWKALPGKENWWAFSTDDTSLWGPADEESSLQDNAHQSTASDELTVPDSLHSSSRVDGQ